MNQPSASRRFLTQGITFHPDPGDVLLCDFDGYRIPEIVKVRPVVVISVDHPGGAQLCLVVPFSTVAPVPIGPVHFHVPAGRYPFSQVEQWVKGDLVAHVGFARLDRIKVGGRFGRFRLPAPDFAEVQRCVLHAIGLGRLIPHL